MKLRELIQKVTDNYDFTQEDWVDFDKIQSFLGLSVWGCDDKQWNARVHEHYYVKWSCTDTHVGYSIIFFDKKPVLLSAQTARKSEKTFEVVDADVAKELTDFILRMSQEGEADPLPVADLDEEIGESFTVGFEQQLLANSITYQNEVFEVVKFHRDWKNMDNSGWLAYIDRKGQSREYLNHIIREEDEDLRYGICQRVAITNDGGKTVKYIPVAEAKISFTI